VSALTGMVGRMLDATPIGSQVVVIRNGETLVTWRHRSRGGWSADSAPYLSVSSEVLACDLDRIDESTWGVAVLIPARRRWWQR
jgi:hypothetical protein